MVRELDELEQKEDNQWFYKHHINVLGDRHVAWIDIMGIQDHLKNRQIYPAVLRGELLSVVSEYIDSSEVELFTAGDGVIIITENKQYLQEFLTALFTHYVKFNINDWNSGEEIYFNRLIRAGVGCGEIHKIDVETYSDEKDEGNPFHSDFANDPFGPGIIDALRAERGAPYSIHEYQSDETIRPVRWWKSSELDYEDRLDLVNMLTDYFDWYEDNHRYQYSPGSKQHLNSTIKYFEIDPSDVDGI